MGVHNSQTPMQWPKMIGCSRPHQQRAIVCPPPLSTQCPGETTSLSLLAGTAASGSLCRPISQSHHHGNGSWRAGRLARPGPPSPRPLPWGGVQGEEMGAEKSAPPPLPPQEARARVSPQGPSIPGCGGPQPPILGRTPAAAQVACPRAPLFSRQVCGSPAVCPPFRALTAGGGAAPPTRTADLAPQPQPYLDVRHFRPRALTPARAWRRHGHFALANRGGGRKQRGKGRKRQPGGPRRDWRG